MELRVDEDLKKSYMLIHGHDIEVSLLDIDQKLVELAILLAANEDYDKTGFDVTHRIRPRIALKSSKVFLTENFRLHKVSYASELLLKLRLNGRIIKDEGDLLRLYNNVGIQVSPFCVPVKFVDKPYYYGKLELVANLADDDEFLKNMNLLFKQINLGKATNQITSVCYVHEIIHTQLESLKGVVKDFYNSEVLSIFGELMYALEQEDLILAETLKYRINIFLLSFDSLSNYILGIDETLREWDVLGASKYLVSTLKAINLFQRYMFGSRLEREHITLLVQQVFDGKITLEEMLQKVDVTYENSIDYQKVLSLIKRK